MNVCKASYKVHWMNKSSIKPLVFLVTGAASGIGAAVARKLAGQGHSVALADINAAGAGAVAAELGENAFALELDITSEKSWNHALDATLARFKRLDVLINNAAIVVTGNARAVSLDMHQRTIDTNFMGPLKGMLLVLPRFIEQGSGHLVTVCSMTSFLPFPGIASYGAGKHALRAFHHALALEERHSPVHFTIVHPTATETPMLEQEEKDDSCAFAFVAEPVTADAVADTILTAIKKKSVEVCMPPEQARSVARLGTDPKRLRKMYDQIEEIGKHAQRERRRQHQTAQAE
jgi:NAD(P)-dependent dehydrogenase (short-subunit alcohol dehydrogenase family)